MFVQSVFKYTCNQFKYCLNGNKNMHSIPNFLVKIACKESVIESIEIFLDLKPLVLFCSA